MLQMSAFDLKNQKQLIFIVFYVSMLLCGENKTQSSPYQNNGNPALPLKNDNGQYAGKDYIVVAVSAHVRSRNLKHCPIFGRF